MATIIKKGSKRKLSPEDDSGDRLKIRRSVYVEVEKLKQQGKTRGLFSEVARQLSLSDDKVRNYYKAESKLVKSASESSAEDYIRMSGGNPTTKVLLLLFAFFLFFMTT